MGLRSHYIVRSFHKRRKRYPFTWKCVRSFKKYDSWQFLKIDNKNFRKYTLYNQSWRYSDNQNYPEY